MGLRWGREPDGRDEALGPEDGSSSDSLSHAGAAEVVPDGRARGTPLYPQSADSHGPALLFFSVTASSSPDQPTSAFSESPASRTHRGSLLPSSLFEMMGVS